MAKIIKHKKIDLKFVKKNYPVLSDTLDLIFKGTDTSEDVQRQVAGLCIEIALKSDGTIDLFEDDLPDDFLGDNIDL